MAEHALSRDPGHVLVTIGLGSCIGLALMDRRNGIAGLVHVVLPNSAGAMNGDGPWKFADTAVPALVKQIVGLGARKAQLEAVLVGGAQMFAFTRKNGTGMDVGRRNEAAVESALAKEGVSVRARSTGGSKGRTIRVQTDTGVVLVKEAGGAPVEIFPAPAGAAT
jgi:chemotaxis protein CheD